MAELRPLYQVNPEGYLEAVIPLRAMAQTDVPVSSDQVVEVEDANGNYGTIRASNEAWGSQWSVGDYVPTMAMLGADDYFRSPTLTTPSDYYTRARWSEEYYQEEGMINAFIDRDIAQAVKPVEFQLPEDKDPTVAVDVLEEWRTTLNDDIGHRGGLNEYNRKLAFSMIKKGMSVTLANWGTVMIENKPYNVPKVFVNFEPLAIVPDFDPLTGERIFYYKLTNQQASAIKDGSAKGFLQIIPDAADRILENVDFIVKKLKGVQYDPTFISGGPFLKLPREGLYSIYYNGQDNERWPMPSLTPIFGAIAMKRKLQLADFSVADGMINMLMIWKFPIGTKPADAKKVIDKFVLGGRVQSHAVPAGVELEIITPPSEILNSSDKFWQPVSEILAHFDYPLNSKSRGAGDLDSGPLDLATNKARLNVIRDYIVGHNDFFLAEIAKRNGWGFKPTALMPRIDLADTDAFRAFIQGLFDRGPLSHQTYLEAAGTTLERELGRIKKEKKMKVDELMPIRPTFAQTTATGADGRPPAGGGLPAPTVPTVPTGANDKQTRNTKGRPDSSAPGNTTKATS